MTELIVTSCTNGMDPSAVAAEAARRAGTQVAGNLRWHGLQVPSHMESPTADGRVIRVLLVPAAESNS